MTVATSPVERQRDEQQLLQDGITVRKLFLDVVQKGVYGLPIEEAIIDGEVVRTMDGPSTVTITIHDQARDILKSKKLQTSDGRLRTIDINLDGLWFRLVNLKKQGDDLLLTFEDRAIVWLKDKKGPRKSASRAKTTRAQYILSLVRSAKKIPPRIPVRIHELNVKQPIAKLTPSERKSSKKHIRSERDREREPGFSKDKVAGLNVHQTDRCETCLIVADKYRVEERAKLAMLTAMAGESDFGENKDSKSNDPRVKPTTFQSMQIPESELDAQAYHFLFGGRSFRAGGAVKAIKDHPDWTIGEVVKQVEVSDGSGNYYDSFVPLARRILKAWGEGGGGTGSKPSSYRARAEFKVEKDETYYDAIIRMAKDVNWRAFMAGDTFRYISEEDLYKSRPRYRFSEMSEGVLNIDFDQDYHKPVATATVDCLIHRWAMVPGTTVYIDDMGMATGKWLVLSVRRSLFSSDATVELKQPMAEKLEPRTDLTERRKDASNDPGDSGSDGKRGGISGDTGKLLDDLKVFLELVAGMTDEDIVVTDGWAPQGTHAPNSNHHYGWAADINVGGDARQSEAAWRKGDNIAVAALRVCGLTYRQARLAVGGPRTSFAQDMEWNGYQVEMGWRTTEGGNHYNHVHIGFEHGVGRKLSKNYPGANP
jgi:hypothetical protein